MQREQEVPTVTEVASRGVRLLAASKLSSETLVVLEVDTELMNMTTERGQFGTVCGAPWGGSHLPPAPAKLKRGGEGVSYGRLPRNQA
jgi:hypothetical protein